MASILKPAMLRQSALLLASRRLATTSAAGIRSSRPSIRPGSSDLPQVRSASIIGSVAQFHGSAQRQILPPGPQVIEGGVNDPAPVPKPSPTHGSYHWTVERLLALGLVPLTIAPFAAGSLNPTMDALLAATVLIHSHIGFQACIIDYFPTWQVPTVRKAASWLLNIATILVGVGFYEFETNDVGIIEAIKRVWTA